MLNVRSFAHCMKSRDSKELTQNILKNTKYGDLEVTYYQIDITSETIFQLKWDGEKFWRVYKGEKNIMSQADIRAAYDFVKGYMYDYIPSRLIIENEGGTIEKEELFPPRCIY